MTWDESQLTALKLVVGTLDSETGLRVPSAVSVLGAPGTGKSRLAVEAAALAVESGYYVPSDVLLLTTGRRAAAVARDALTLRLGRTLRGVTVRSVASVAFAILAHDCKLQGLPAPQMMTGPEQDADLAALLDGHKKGLGTPIAWPASIGAETLGLRGFRAELRDLLMRCAERGIMPDQLALLGAAQNRPEWTAAAQVYEEYLNVGLISRSTPDAGPRYDAARIIDVASDVLAAWHRDDEPNRLRWKVVIIDDYQDATAAVAGLLGCLAADGSRLALFGDPDVSAQGFRGARPDLLAKAAARPGSATGGSRESTGAFNATQVALDTVWSQPPGLRAVTQTVIEHISTAGTAVHRKATARVTPGCELSPIGDHRGDADHEHLPSSVENSGIVVRRHARSGAQEPAIVARMLREEHVLLGVPWSQMAVILRSNGQANEMRRALVTAGVPVKTCGLDRPMRDEPAVRALLTLVAAGSATYGDAEPIVHLTEEQVLDLLYSPFGNFDSLGLRRLRRALLSQERAGGGTRTSGELLIEAVTRGDGLATINPDIAGGAVRVSRMCAAATVRTSTAHSALWAVWEASQVSAGWRSSALRDGPAGARADHDLDAILAVFRDAEIAAERHQRAGAQQFAEELLAQDLAADSLAARGGGVDAVQVLSPAEAVGRHWQIVVISGVQDGQWPDLRLRDSLLGSQALADFVDGRGEAASDSPEAKVAENPRRAILDDELRMFAVAVSRATRKLFITAVDDEESVPSVFCDLVAPEGPEEWNAQHALPLDLRGLVIRTRTELAGADESSAPAWAYLLGSLASQGVREADPQRWYGTAAPSSSASLAGASDPVFISPSKVGLVHQCSLRWSLEVAGGSAGGHIAAGLGTLIHSIAQENPTASIIELRAELHRRWQEIDPPQGWPGKQLFARAEKMIGMLGEFQELQAAPVAVEEPFNIAVGRAQVRGSIDRVDHGDRGVIVTDYKTGRTALPADAARVDPQMAIYQLAVERSGPQNTEATADPARISQGARLVYLGTGNAKLTMRNQQSLEAFPNPAWVEQMIEQSADIMAAGQFWASVNEGCRNCGVARSCPVQPSGEMLVPPRIDADEPQFPAPPSQFHSVGDRESHAGIAGQGSVAELKGDAQ